MFWVHEIHRLSRIIWCHFLKDRNNFRVTWSIRKWLNFPWTKNIFMGHFGVIWKWPNQMDAVKDLTKIYMDETSQLWCGLHDTYCVYVSFLSYYTSISISVACQGSFFVGKFLQFPLVITKGRTNRHCRSLLVYLSYKGPSKNYVDKMLYVHTF